MASEGPCATVHQARLYTVGRGPVPRRAPVLTANVRGLGAAGVFRFGGESAGGTRSDARVACEGPRATVKPIFCRARSPEALAYLPSTLDLFGIRSPNYSHWGTRAIAGGTRSHARVACEGPRATIKKTVLEPSQLCSGSGWRGTNVVSMQRRRDSLSTNHCRNPRGNGKHTVGENKAWAFCSAYAFFLFTKSQRCDKLIPQETLLGLPRMPDSPAGTTVFVLRPS